MVDQDITQTLETITTKPNEAIENIAQASKEGSNPDSYAQSNGGVDPSKKVQTTMVDRKLASEMQDSSQVASAVSLDVTKMDWGAKMGSYAGLSIRQSDAGRERARLANQVRELRRSGKPVPEDLEWDLAAWRDEANSISADIEKLQLGDISKGVASIPTFLTDQFKDMWKQKEIVAGSTAAGSAAGGLLGSLTIPLIGTFAGWAGGGAAGFVVGSMAASARENYNRMAGEVYDELSIATTEDKVSWSGVGPDGKPTSGISVISKPLNISEEEKNNIATGVALLSSGLELIADKIGLDNIPIVKRVLSAKYVKEGFKDSTKRGVLRSLGRLTGKMSIGAFAEGSTEAIQEFTQMVGEELGQTWDGKESSLARAFDNLANKLTSKEIAKFDDKGNKITVGEQTRGRLKSAAVIGAVAGGTVAGVGNIIPSADKDEDVTAAKPPQAPPTTQPIIEKQPSDFIQVEDGVPLSMSPQKSVNLAVALKGISDATVDTALGKKTPVDAEAIQARMLKESGINEVWVAPEDLNKWSNTQEKADYVRRKLTPNQIKDLEMGASVAIDPATILEMIRTDDSAAKFVRPSADGMSFDEVIKAYETGSQRAQEFLKQQGTAQATEAPMVEVQGVPAPLEQAEMPPTAGLGPSSTDEEIIATLGTRQEANAYLDRLASEESRLSVQSVTDLKRSKTVEKKQNSATKLREILEGAEVGEEQKVLDAIKPYLPKGSFQFLEDAQQDLDLLKNKENKYPFLGLKTLTSKLETEPSQLGAERIRKDLISKIETLVEQERKSLVNSAPRVLEQLEKSASLLQVGKGILDTKNQERLTQVQQMRERVQTLTEQLPDQPTAGLGPSSTDEEIIATLGTRQEANAYLDRLATEESRLKKIYHGTSGPEFEKLDPARSGGMVNFAEEKFVAEDYAHGAGGGRSRVTDNSELYIERVGSNESGRLDWNPETKSYEGMWGNERLSVPSQDAEDFIRESGDASVRRKSGRILESSYDPSKVLDITKSEENRTVLLNILQSLASKGNKAAKKIVEESLYRGEPDLINSAWWGTTKLAKGTLYNPKMGEELQQISKTLKDTGYDGLRFNDDTGVTVALFEPSDRLQQIQAMRERVQALAETLPDQPTVRPEGGADLTEQEIADAAFDSYMQQPLMTDLIRAGVPREALAGLESEYRRIRSEIVAATQEAADKEMGQVKDQLVDLAQLEAEIEANTRAVSDPNVAMVELFLSNRNELAIDPNSLSVEQKIKYIDDGVLTARKAFKKGGIDPETLAVRLGLESGDAVLQMLATTPDRKRTVENAMNFTKEQLSLEAADKIEISSASILKVLTDKQKMNLKEFKHFVETSWVKARNGIEGIIFSNINLDTIREETKTKVQQTKLSALSPKAYERASKLAAKRKVKSGLRGDTLESARQREIEIRADEFLKQTYETIGKANKAIKQINRMMRNPGIQESLRKAGMQDAFVDLAAIINLGDQRGKSDVGAFEKLQAKLVSEQTADISIPQELINTFDPRATLKDLSYEQVDFIRNKMKELVKLAESKNTFREGQEQKAFDAVKDVVIQDIKSSPYYDNRIVGAEGEFDAGVMDAVTSKFDLIDASMTNIQYIMTQISPDDTSPIHQLIVDQLFGVGNYKNSGYGYAAYNKIKGQIRKRINDHLDKYGRKRIETYGYTWVDAPELAGSQFLLNKNGRILKSQLLAAVGLYGSETGRQRLSNYGVDPDLIKQVAEKHLTQEDFDFNQEAIHDTFELMRPEIERVFRDLGKEPPDFIQGLGYKAHNKTYRGGYVNIRYRDDVSVDASNRRDQQKVKELTGETKTRPIEPESLKDMTYQGQYESRVETYEGIPSLDFATNIAIGIENVVTDVAMNVPIKEVMKLLTDKDISQEMVRVVGPKKHSILKNHVMSAGKSLTSDQLALFKDVESEWQSVFDSIGSKVIAGTLLGLPSSVIAQFSSGVFLWHTLGIRSTGTYLGVWAKILTNPRSFGQLIEWAGKIDPSIGQYAQNIDERTFGEIYNILPKRRSDYKVTRWLETGSNALSNVYFKTAMNTIDTMMKTSAIATAYSRFLSGKTPGYDVKTLAKLPDAEKIRLAESYAFNQVNRTGTSSTILDRAYFQKSTVFKGYANYFNDARNIYNYAMTYTARPIKNNIKGIVADVKSGDIKSATRKSFDTGYRLATLQMATAVAATIINMARGRDTEGEEMPEFLTLGWEVKMLENLGKNIINPFSVTNVILAGPAILRDVIYSVDTAIESEGRYINQVAPVHVKAINNIVGGIYALNQLVTNLELSTNEQKLLLKGVGSIVPNIPFNAAGKLISSEGSRSTVDAIAADPGILISATAYAAWVIQQAISKGDFATANAAREIEKTLINPAGSLNVKDLMSGQVKALTPEEIGIIGYTESSGQQGAVSSIGAAGLYQFTQQTWENLMFTYPELGLTYAGRTAKDTTEQEIAMDRLVRDNAVTLLQNNVEITLNSVYAAHHFGSGKISKLWNLEDTAAVKSILGDSVYKSNPWLRGGVSWINNGRPVKNVGDFKRGIQDLLNRGRELYNEEVMKDFNLD